MYNHLWEQPHIQPHVQPLCQGSNCEFCVKQGYNFPNPQRAAGGGGGGDSISLGGANDNLTTGRGLVSNYHRDESYFRFAIDGAVFRVMILCKDKQNILNTKITSYDFLLIAMQVILTLQL